MKDGKVNEVGSHLQKAFRNFPLEQQASGRSSLPWFSAVPLPPGVCLQQELCS